ncbi:MAG: carbon-nitrogen hydrolase [Terriglobales bacterium]
MARETVVAVLQARVEEAPGANLARTLAQIERAAAQGAQLVVTPELFLTPYFCQREDHARFALAEPIPGPTTAALGAAARRLGVVIVASLFERRAAGIYHNTAVVLDADGELRGRYRKMHIPDDPLYQEKFYFTPGDLGFQVFPTRAGAVGVLVCWDQWFPEAARLTALAGAEILCYPTAIGWHPAEKAEWGARQLAAWQTVQRGHAIANGLFIAVPNRTGLERDPGFGAGEAGSAGIEFWGHSFIADPSGQVVAEAGEAEEAIVLARCDLDLVERTRQHWPFLRDRRVDAYAALTQRLTD